MSPLACWVSIASIARSCGARAVDLKRVQQVQHSSGPVIGSKGLTFVFFRRGLEVGHPRDSRRRRHWYKELG